jgi:hypothetical protein
MDLKQGKTVLVTNRNNDCRQYVPAEELIIESVGIEYERVEYCEDDFNNFFGRLPVLYCEGCIIPSGNIASYCKDLIGLDINKKDDPDSFDDKLEYLLFILKDQLRFASEYLYFLKKKEKKQSELKKYFESNLEYERIANKQLNSFGVFSKLKYMYIPLEEKLIEIIKDVYRKIEIFTKKYFRFNNNTVHSMSDYFMMTIIYSFIKSDILLFSGKKIKRLIQHEESTYNSMNNFIKYYEKLEKLKIGSQACSPISHSLHPNPKKKKIQNLQELQITRSLRHNLFSIGIFSITAVLIFYISTRKK